MIVFFVFVLETRSGKEIDVKCEVPKNQKTNRYLVLVLVLGIPQVNQDYDITIQ